MHFPEGAFQKLGEMFVRGRREQAPGPMDYFQILVCGLMIAAFIWILHLGLLTHFEKRALDAMIRHQPQSARTSENIAIIEIKEDSLQSIGAWPWPVDYHAEMIRILSQAGAKAIIFDSPLKMMGLPDEGAELAKAMRQAGNVYLSVILGKKAEKKIWVHQLPIVLEPEGEGKVWARNPAQFEQLATGLGHMNLIPDSDGVLRRAVPYLGYSGEIYPFLGLRVAKEFRGEEVPMESDLKISLDQDGTILIPWKNKFKEAFEHYSYADVIQSAKAISQNLRPAVSLDGLSGKICIVGATLADLTTTYLTPTEANTPSANVIAQFMQGLLKEQMIIPVSFQLHAISLFALGVIAGILFIYLRGGGALIAGFILILLCAAFAFVAFVQQGLWFYVVHPTLLVVSLFVALATYDQIVTARERKHLFDLATRDGLTGLFVIRHFREISNRVVAEAARKKENIAVILIDIDNFKKINDTYGHPAGDMVLRKTAQLVHAKLRSKRPIHQVDFVARYGGEEFIILLRNTSLKEASEKVGERIREAIEKAVFRWHDVMIPVTVSVGVSAFRFDEAIPDPMVHRADEALYDAKHSGKNRVCVEHPIG